MKRSSIEKLVVRLARRILAREDEEREAMKQLNESRKSYSQLLK